MPNRCSRRQRKNLEVIDHVVHVLTHQRHQLVGQLCHILEQHLALLTHSRERAHRGPVREYSQTSPRSFRALKWPRRVSAEREACETLLIKGHGVNPDTLQLRLPNAAAFPERQDYTRNRY
jgi:hypothetical protein